MTSIVFLLQLGCRGGGGTSKEGEDSLYSKIDRIESCWKSKAYKGSEKLHPGLESGAGKSHCWSYLSGLIVAFGKKQWAGVRMWDIKCLWDDALEVIICIYYYIIVCKISPIYFVNQFQLLWCKWKSHCWSSSSRMTHPFVLLWVGLLCLPACSQEWWGDAGGLLHKEGWTGL